MVQALGRIMDVFHIVSGNVVASPILIHVCAMAPHGIKLHNNELQHNITYKPMAEKTSALRN